jgi:hypothetical protein
MFTKQFIPLFRTPIAYTGMCLNKTNNYRVILIPKKTSDIEYLRNEQYFQYDIYKHVIADITGCNKNKYFLKRLDNERILYETNSFVGNNFTHEQLHNLLIFHYSQNFKDYFYWKNNVEYYNYK